VANAFNLAFRDILDVNAREANNESFCQHLREHGAAIADSLAFMRSTAPGARNFYCRLDLLDFAIRAAPRNGYFAEFGVYGGESLNFIARRTKDVVYGFDAFEGLPAAWTPEVARGTFDIGGQRALHRIRFEPNVSLRAGWFNNTLPSFVTHVRPPIAAFLHVDCDLYSSSAEVLGALENQIVPGTVIVFDEYFSYPGWREGEHKALMELVASRNLNIEYMACNLLGSEFGQQAAVKVQGYRGNPVDSSGSASTEID
jgi:hypothetical protein